VCKSRHYVAVSEVMVCCVYRAEMDNPEVSLRFGLILEAYCRGSITHMDNLQKQVHIYVYAYVYGCGSCICCYFKFGGPCDLSGSGMHVGSLHMKHNLHLELYSV